MTRYQYRRSDDDAWHACSAADARAILSRGYFDPDIPLAHLETGATVVTSTHAVRVNPTLLMVQRNEPTPEPNGDVIWA